MSLTRRLNIMVLSRQEPSDEVLSRIRDLLCIGRVDVTLMAPMIESTRYQGLDAERGLALVPLDTAGLTRLLRRRQHDLVVVLATRATDRLLVGVLRSVGSRSIGLDAGSDGWSVQELARAAGRPGAGLESGPAMSVVATVRNESETVDRLVSRVLAQLGPTDEFVITDGGSTDGTLERLLQRRDGDGRLQVLSRPGTNISAGRNAAIAQARHAVIACTDAGCDPAPGWLEALRAPFAEVMPPGLVASVPEVSGHGSLHLAQALACYPHPHDFAHPSLLVRSYGRLFGQVFTPKLPFGRSLAFRVDAWKTAGGFPENLGWTEDGVFGLAVARDHVCDGTIDAEIVWQQRNSLRSTARMYFNYGVGAAQSGDVTLVLRDVLRACAYGTAALCLARAPRRSIPVLSGSALLYYSLPLSRVIRARAGWRTAMLVPVVMAVKDFSKVAGAASVHSRGAVTSSGGRTS